MMTWRTMRGFLVPLFLLTASLAGCGDVSDEESSPSTSTHAEGVGEALEGLELRALPATDPPEGASKTDFGASGDPRAGARGGNPGDPGDEVYEPVPVPWDTPRVKVASEG